MNLTNLLFYGGAGMPVVPPTIALAIGMAVALGRGLVGPDAKTARGRLRGVAWNVALIVLSAVLANALSGVSWAWLIILAAAVLVVAHPRLVRAAVAVVLVVLGLTGVAIARRAGYGYGVDQIYGMTLVGQLNLTFYLLLPQAYFFLSLGTWLGWRVVRPGREVPGPRRLLGRMAEPGNAARPWALLLLPVTVIAAAAATPNLWFGAQPTGVIWPVLVLGAAVWFIRAEPGRAAATAAFGLIGLGLAGVYLGVTYSGAGWPLPLNGAGYVEYGVIDVTSQTMADLAVIQGLALAGAGLLLAPRVAPGLVRYLGVEAYRDLAQRIQRLTETRAVAVDTAAADLRRLERDLHDGAQARLVALGMHLRAVEKLIPTSPDAALALVAEARETSARALTELRELVRGVHPPVLADRGLADALRALALDCPLRTETEIDLSGRLPASIETACYFAAAELLTNAAKHSGARAARVSAEHRNGVLRIVVTDFGIGGADVAAGSGLAGVERRLATFDGVMAVSSPPGGPTMVVIEVPCVLSPVLLSS